MATASKHDAKVDSITIDYKTYLGGGSFGHIYKGKYREDEVAVKVINTHMLVNKGKYKDIDKNEIIPYLRGLNHPNIISIYAVEDHGYELWLALELCDSSVDKFLEENNPNDSLTLDILRQGATGLGYLHNNGIIHRDLRPDNQLILMKGSHLIIKITDFSLSKDIGSQPTSSMTTVFGNRNWLAPELLAEDGGRALNVRYKRSIDVFSYALCIIYVCVTNAGREIINRVCCGAMVKRGQDVLVHFENDWRSSGLKKRFLSLLQRMLSLDPNSRPTIDEAFSPVIVSTCPVFHHLASHILEYIPHHHMGIGSDNFVLAARRRTDSFQLLQGRGGSFQKVWAKPCSQGLDWMDRKFIVGDLVITRGNDRYLDSTRCWDLKLNQLHEHQVEGDLALVSCFSPHGMAYCEEIEVHSYQLVIYNGDNKETTLRPPAGSPWNKDISMCRHAGTGWFAVCEYNTNALDIFEAGGRHQHHIKLSYEPLPSNAICCTDSHIIIGEYQDVTFTGHLAIHIHAWNGQEVQKVDLQRQLGLDKFNKKLCSVDVCDGGNTLCVVVNTPRYSAYSVHALKIETTTINTRIHDEPYTNPCTVISSL